MEIPNYESPWSSNGKKLFLLGFITLFLELALIRYLAGNIWNMGYFPNLVLMAVFMGMGAGFIFHHYIHEKTEPILFQAAFAFILVLVAFVYFGRPKVPGFDQQGGVIAGELFFTGILVAETGRNYIPLLLCFIFLIIIFALISQRTAKLFRLFKPLTAYSLDISGSCAGIIFFMIASVLELPAYAWFIFLATIFPLAMSGSWKSRLMPPLIGIVIIIFAYQQDTKLSAAPDQEDPFNVYWSPYQKIELLGGVIFVNGVGHQRMENETSISEVYYFPPYTDRAAKTELPPYKSVLVLGSGTGNDVAAALASGVEHVDAVEIDPVIARIGKEYHTLKPYQDDRVRRTVDDGRTFMTHTDQRYDLIVFALTDSVIKVSSLSQLRLENYLFTKEAVEKAYSLLNENGDLIFYNLYRRPWLVVKIRDMVFSATGKLPEVVLEPEPPAYFAVLRVNKSLPDEDDKTYKVKFDIPDDDWPFLYLKKRGIPSIYMKAMIGMCLFVAMLIFIMHRSTRRLEQYGGTDVLLIKLAFVFMGIAFMLLETKSVIQFSLLFGTTWLNNSLVFLAVLLLILAANWTALLIKGKEALWLIYILLLASSLSTLVYPLGNLLELSSPAARFVIASLLTFSPIFFANLIFSITFRDLNIAEHIFGWNLIGATIGGIAEYSSMALGYNLLAVIVAVCYTMVFVFITAARRLQTR